MKRTICLVLALITILSCAICFSGCTKDSGGSTNTPTAAPANNGNSGSSTPAPASSGEEIMPTEQYFPLAERAEISAWAVWVYDQPSQVWSDWNDSPAYQELERRTNVHVNFVTPTFGSEREQCNLMIASQEYPDLISAFSSYYSKGIVDGIENEICIPVDDIVNNYMPNYQQKIKEFGIEKEVRTDEGYMGAIWGLNHRKQYPRNGLGIRKDFLDKLGLEVPETYAELKVCLEHFRDDLGLPAPMNLDGMNVGGDFISNLFAPGYGAIGTIFQKDGTVYYGPLMEEYRDYLAMCAQWYQEGLIDHDFDTNNPLFGNGEVMALNDEVGYTLGCDNIGTWEENSHVPINPDYYLLPVPCMTLNKGEHTHFGVIQNYVEVDTVVTTSADPANYEVLGRWMDYCYSDDAYYIMSYGIEGTTYYIDDVGEPCLCVQWCEDYFNTTFENVKRGFTCIRMPFVRDIYMGRDCHKTDGVQRKTYYESGPIWAADDAAWQMPPRATMTPEETTEYSRIATDINTLMVETFTAIIKGAKPLSAWDEFVNTCNSMGVDKMIAIKQASLDRYNAR